MKRYVPGGGLTSGRATVSIEARPSGGRAVSIDSLAPAGETE